ncbi:MAG: carboxypeptidase-like regulatory domain-containing protein [Thermoanaerobaculum sp.]|nr:carboxypeptidase-like regulatory domain-containing protein [Thermoanaerobaculum sp.]MDW7966993.1 carboxypeptidase-like regulatory domain-containing protein [Thermoanaerobaculum sp.]
MTLASPGGAEVLLGLEAGLEVQVRGEDGQGLAGANLELALPGPPGSPVRLLEAQAYTDGEGVGVMATLTPGSYRLKVGHTHYLPRELEVELPEGVSRQEVTLQRGATVTVQVLRAGEQAPVAGPEVRLEALGQGRAFHGPTAEAGDCRLTGVSRGSYRASASIPNLRAHAQRLVVTGPGDTRSVCCFWGRWWWVR